MKGTIKKITAYMLITVIIFGNILQIYPNTILYTSALESDDIEAIEEDSIKEDESSVETIETNSSLENVSTSTIEPVSGEWENITWKLLIDGTLEISGEGDMPKLYADEEAPWFNFRTDITKVIINGGITNIGDLAFELCSNLKTITIPDNVKSIGSRAFNGCSNLIDVTIPESVTSIGQYAFQNCNSLETITLPDGLTIIDGSVFRNCNNLKTITILTNVNCIAHRAFEGCSNITSIMIPDNVTIIGEYAFDSCSSLTSIALSDNVKSIGNGAFSGCSNLTDVIIPKNITQINRDTFEDCSSLMSIKIPDNVKSIGDGAFSGCSNLIDITIPESVTSIGFATFYNCSSITNITIPNSVTSLEGYAFANCRSLTTMAIPTSISSIEYATFKGCSSLTSIIIPDNITSIGSEAFIDCASLTSITIPDNVKTIFSHAFSGCTNLKSIEIPRIESLENGVFSRCENLTKIELPNSITTIEGNVFSGCTNLTSITIPDNVTSIGENAFKNCSSLENITIPENVTSIGESVFEGCSSLINIIIPDNITSIENRIFYDCNKLENMKIPDNVTSIGDYAFAHCSSLNNITIPDKVTNIGNGAFYECSSLTSISIPDKVTSIENRTFQSCRNIMTITLPDNITNIGDYAFGNCNSLATIIIPNSVTKIGHRAFLGCSSIKNIIIPNNVTSIGVSSFSNCSSLTSITIPNSVTSIGGNSFYGCDKLQDVYYTGSEEQWNLIDKAYNIKLDNVTIHYNSNGNLYNGGNLDIKEFLNWDEEEQKASFSDSLYTYTVNEETDMSFLDSVNDLIGQKVLVVTDPNNVGILLGIYSVDKIEGTISNWSPSSVTINDVSYPAAQDFSYNGTILVPTTKTICYLHNNTVVGMEIGEERTGILEEWNGNTNEITIDGNTYQVKADDMSFLGSIQLWMDKTITFVVLEGNVVQVNLGSYQNSYTGKLESYDDTGLLHFSDGKEYYISDDLKDTISEYMNKWGVYVITTSQENGTEITAVSPVTVECKITLDISEKDIYYKDGKYSYDNENFINRGELEIPYTIRIENSTNASGSALSQLKNETEYDIEIKDLNIEVPSNFNFGWLSEGDIQSIKNGTVLHIGDVIGANGYIRPSIGFRPESYANTYTVKCLLNTASGDISSENTFTITQNLDDSSTNELKDIASQSLEELSGYVQLVDMSEYIDKDTEKAISNALLSVALMANADKDDLKEVLTEKLFDDVFGDWKFKTSANAYDVPVQIAVNTKNHGELIFKFTLHITSFDLDGTRYGIFGSIDYEIVGGEKLDEISDKTKENAGIITQCDVTAFCESAYKLAEGEIKKAYNKIWGEEANKVGDIIFGQTVTQILDAMDTSYSDMMFKIITTPAKSYSSYCPVDVYVYDESGNLYASIVDNKIENIIESDSIYLEVVGDTKVVTLWDDNFKLKYVSNDKGKMDIIVTEFAGMNNILRTVEFDDLPLGNDISYSTEVPENLLAGEYILVDDNNKEIKPDRNIIYLDEMDTDDDVQDHTHEYGNPVFNWSTDYQTCTAIFTCKDGDDQQKISCTIESFTNEENQLVYKATVEFGGISYTDSQVVKTGENPDDSNTDNDNENDNSNTGTSSEPGSTGISENNDKTDKNKAVKTGDNNMSLQFAGLQVLSISVFIVVKKRIFKKMLKYL